MHVGDTVAVLPLGAPGPLGDGAYEQARVVKLFGFEGLERVELEAAAAGEIVALAGLAGAAIGRPSPGPLPRQRPAGVVRAGPPASVGCEGNEPPPPGRERQI